jgi:hypothetical protein
VVHYLNWKLLRVVARVSRRRRTSRKKRLKLQGAAITPAVAISGHGEP